MNRDIFVVVANNDQETTINGKKHYDDNGPIVFEQYTRTASLRNMRKRKKQLEKRYGKCRIAKLSFIEEPVYSEGICEDGAAILKDGEKMTIDEILNELNCHS